MLESILSGFAEGILFAAFGAVGVFILWVTKKKKFSYWDMLWERGELIGVVTLILFTMVYLVMYYL